MIKIVLFSLKKYGCFNIRKFSFKIKFLEFKHLQVILIKQVHKFYQRKSAGDIWKTIENVMLVYI